MYLNNYFSRTECACVCVYLFVWSIHFRMNKIESNIRKRNSEFVYAHLDESMSLVDTNRTNKIDVVNWNELHANSSGNSCIRLHVGAFAVVATIKSWNGALVVCSLSFSLSSIPRKTPNFVAQRNGFISWINIVSRKYILRIRFRMWVFHISTYFLRKHCSVFFDIFLL